MYMSNDLYKTYCFENLSKNTAELQRNNKNDISSLASFFLLPACSSDRIDLHFSFDRIKQGLESHFSYLEEDEYGDENRVWRLVGMQNNTKRDSEDVLLLRIA